MEPSIGVSCGALLRLDGDEDLAPRVLTMADSEDMGGGARGLGLDGREKMEGCSSLALLWHLFEVQMTGLLEMWNLYR